MIWAFQQTKPIIGRHVSITAKESIPTPSPLLEWPLWPCLEFQAQQAWDLGLLVLEGPSLQVQIKNK